MGFASHACCFAGNKVVVLISLLRTLRGCLQSQYLQKSFFVSLSKRLFAELGKKHIIAPHPVFSAFIEHINKASDNDAPTTKLHLSPSCLTCCWLQNA
eukprot:1839607-Amphidinium_carterae.1